MTNKNDTTNNEPLNRFNIVLIIALCLLAAMITIPKLQSQMDRIIQLEEELKIKNEKDDRVYLESGSYYSGNADNNIITDPISGTQYANNELIVFLKEDINEKEFEKIIEPLGGKITGHLLELRVFIVTFDNISSKEKLTEIQNEIQSNEIVNEVSFNTIITR